MEQEIILSKLNSIEQLLQNQAAYNKPVLNLKEAATYLDISPSHLYKLTSSRAIPHFCPQGKKLYFNRTELDEWLQRNRQDSAEDIENLADSFTLKSPAK